MRKHNRVRVVLAVAVFAAIFTICAVAGADDSSPWISSSPTIKQQSGSATAPPTMFSAGDVDCYQDDSGCSVPTAYGSSQNGSVSLGGKYYPVITYIDGRQHFLPIPDSPAFITYSTGAPYGVYMYFNYSFSGSVKLVSSLVNGFSQTNYLVNEPPDGKLTDKNGKLLAGDSTSVSFSPNGQWMVVSEPNVAVLRVNLQTFEVLPFARGLSYSSGLNPAPKTAITNDGRYAFVASKTAGRFEIYDLDTCAAVPASFSGPVSCQYRDLGDDARQQIQGFETVYQVRFLDDSSAMVYAGYSTGLSSGVGRFVVSPGGAPAQLDYLALGDSYISGEGAFDYMPGTDTGLNTCHLSFLSYPLLIGYDLGYDSYHSVACSGATTDDITNENVFYQSQADRKDHITRAVWDKTGQSTVALDSFIPGYVDQLDFVKTYQPKAVTISIGGNDMYFSQILKKCVAPSLPLDRNTCYNTYEDRLEIVNQINSTVLPNLIKTYQALKNAGPPDMRIYAIGYPQIAKPGGDCALNVHLNNDELIFAQQLTDYLDGVIQTAAARTGVYYVDTQDALYGHRLCEAKPGSVAMNGLTAGDDTPITGVGPIGNESYHPNALGYELLENKILATTGNLTALMPSSDTAASIPAEKEQLLLNAPSGGRSINDLEYDTDISDDLVYRGSATDVTIDGNSHGLGAGTVLQAQLHSQPLDLGSYSTDSAGNLSARITIPADAPGGYHALHFYGTDLDGQKIDIYKDLWVACTAEDWDCDGVSDSTEPCIGIPSAGQDYDQDGIDDACDADITLPPANNNQPTAAMYNQTVAAETKPIDISSGPGDAIAADSLPAGGSQTPTAVLADKTQKDSGAVLSARAKNSNDDMLAYLAAGAGATLVVIAGLVKRLLV